MAVNWVFNPNATLGLVGVTPMETSTAGVTVNELDPDNPAIDALIVTEPGVSAVLSPVAPTLLLTAAMVESEELQFTTLVKSCFELSL